MKSTFSIRIVSGAVTISHSISITSEFEAGVLVSGTNGIIVNVGATDKVLLEGLDIEGLGTGLNGIQIIGGGSTVIRKCSIRNFTGNGINLVGTNARSVIEETLLRGNVGGLNIQGAANSGNVAFLRNSLLESNTTFTTQTTGPSLLVLIGSTLTGSPSSIISSGGATVDSYGNNVSRNAGVPTQTLVLQ